jgi:hypothetical protein
MAKSPDQLDDETKRIMAALVRMPPKPHDQMKLGKPRVKKTKSPEKPSQQKAEK